MSTSTEIDRVIKGFYCIYRRCNIHICRPHFYQTRSAWSVDQVSNKNHSPAYNFAPNVTKFCVMWEGLSLPHDTKVGNCRCKIVDSRAFPSWSLIHGLRWSGLIKAEPGLSVVFTWFAPRMSISQEICTRFCCALLCCGYAIVHNEFTWTIYPYSSGLLCWHWGNR